MATDSAKFFFSSKYGDGGFIANLYDFALRFT